MDGSKSADGIWSEQHGGGDAVLLLVHGLGANGAVWDPLLELAIQSWPGKIVVPDLRGHGRSDHRDNYSFGTMAADLAGLIAPGARVSIIGHSLGGLLGAFLGSGWFGVEVDDVLALSVKMKWSPEEIEKGRAVARNPVKWLPSRDEALGRYLRVSGLDASAARIRRSADAGIVERDGSYRLAMDGRVFGTASLGVRTIVDAARCPVAFATGEADPLAPSADFAELGVPVTIIGGAGHQVPVEAPADVWRLFSDAHRSAAKPSA
ncbi:Pimeloyl-ACP methyl ester carboxylesterase [Rhizorhabdus histidinilytica]|uniref:Pimeloyl-ACP methyl ester carboxylesterase n=2 Tax=Rhizorhabdus histidinilytica TaxID=439228 RepID=A0A1T5GUG1_9SPHN|nr:Pimeloyl-ACP methyl ester carboxylesterase [Rhizorhabdus histidinilytica]